MSEVESRGVLQPKSRNLIAAAQQLTRYLHELTARPRIKATVPSPVAQLKAVDPRRASVRGPE